MVMKNKPSKRSPWDFVLLVATCILFLVVMAIACTQTQSPAPSPTPLPTAATTPTIGMSQTELVRILGLPLRIETYEIRETGAVIKMLDYPTATIWVSRGKIQRISEKDNDL